MKLLLLLFLLPFLSLSAPARFDTFMAGADDDVSPEEADIVVGETPVAQPQSSTEAPTERKTVENNLEKTSEDHTEAPVLESAVPETDFDALAAAWGIDDSAEEEEPKEDVTHEAHVQPEAATPVEPESDVSDGNSVVPETTPAPLVETPVASLEVPTPEAPEISELEAFVDGMGDEDANGEEDPSVDISPVESDTVDTEEKSNAAEPFDPVPEPSVEAPLDAPEAPTPEGPELSELEAFVDGLGDEEANGDVEPTVDVTNESPAEPEHSEDTPSPVEEASGPVVETPIQAPEEPLPEVTEISDLQAYVDDVDDEVPTAIEDEENAAQEPEVEVDSEISDEPSTAPDTPADDETAYVSPENVQAAIDDESVQDRTEEEKPEDFSDAFVEQIVSSETPQAVEPVGFNVEEETPQAVAIDVDDKPAVAAIESEQPVQPQPAIATSDPTFHGVTLHVALQATWTESCAIGNRSAPMKVPRSTFRGKVAYPGFASKVNVSGSRRRGYVVHITNGSDKDVCGVTFAPNSDTKDFWNLSVSDDGSFTTKDLQLAPGATANQFGYISIDRSRPTIISVAYC